MYSIENESLRVTVNEKGGELVSILSKSSGREFLWQGDAKYWEDRAPLLFPICGRLTEGKYTYKGKAYRMDIHGFVKDAMLSVTEQTGDAVTLTLESNAETLSLYPFPFVYAVTYRLEGNTLVQAMRVRNTGSEVLPYSLGGHPGFNVPLEEGLAFDDYTITFLGRQQPERICLSDSGFLLGSTQPIPLENGRLGLRHDLFDHDAIFLCNVPSAVRLEADKSAVSVTVSYPDMPYLGLWHMPMIDAPYLCIEPWNGLPARNGVVDDFADKVAMLQLTPGCEKIYTITMTMEE